MPSGDAFRTLFAPEICRTLIDSDIVALSAADVLKLYAKASAKEGVSVSALAKEDAVISDIVIESEAGVVKAKADDSLKVAEFPIPVDQSVVNGSSLLAVSTRLSDSVKALTKLVTLLKLSLTLTDSVRVPKVKPIAACSSNTGVSASNLEKVTAKTSETANISAFGCPTIKNKFLEKASSVTSTADKFTYCTRPLMSVNVTVDFRST